MTVNYERHLALLRQRLARASQRLLDAASASAADRFIGIVVAREELDECYDEVRSLERRAFQDARETRADRSSGQRSAVGSERKGS